MSQRLSVLTPLLFAVLLAAVPALYFAGEMRAADVRTGAGSAWITWTAAYLGSQAILTNALLLLLTIPMEFLVHARRDTNQVGNGSRSIRRESLLLIVSILSWVAAIGLGYIFVPELLNS